MKLFQYFCETLNCIMVKKNPESPCAKTILFTCKSLLDAHKIVTCLMRRSLICSKIRYSLQGYCSILSLEAVQCKRLHNALSKFEQNFYQIMEFPYFKFTIYFNDFNKAKKATLFVSSNNNTKKKDIKSSEVPFYFILEWDKSYQDTRFSF